MSRAGSPRAYGEPNRDRSRDNRQFRSQQRCESPQPEGSTQKWTKSYKEGYYLEKDGHKLPDTQSGPRDLDYWVDAYTKELDILPELETIELVASRFGGNNVRFIDIPPFVREGQNGRRPPFPGTIVECATKTKEVPLYKAYKEHTAAMLNPSRLVLWADASRGPLDSGGQVGLGVAWRRGVGAAWSDWEVLGFKVQENVSSSYRNPLNSDEAEPLAVIQALKKAHDLVAQELGRLKTVIVYTDSSSTLSASRRPRKPLHQQIVQHAEDLKKLGVEIVLRWCPGHKKVRMISSADDIGHSSDQTGPRK